MSINLALLLAWLAVMALIIIAVARSPQGRLLMQQFLEKEQPPQERTENETTDS